MLSARTGLNEYDSSLGVSRRRVGVTGFEPEGELKLNNRFLEGVVGRVDVDAVALVLVRSGEDGRALGGVTSECRIDVKREFACSDEYICGLVLVLCHQRKR